MTYPFVVRTDVGSTLPLPPMYEVRQRFEADFAIDPVTAVDEEWAAVLPQVGSRLTGARVAVAVGSRGIGDLVPIVRAVVGHLRAAGARPFIVPAMGSHGGATAEGQTEVLAQLGITEEAVGAPIEATMDVVTLGEADGIALFLDRLAHDADGIVLINRVKPHTDFIRAHRERPPQDAGHRSRQSGGGRPLPPPGSRSRHGGDDPHGGTGASGSALTCCSASASSRANFTTPSRSAWCHGT